MLSHVSVLIYHRQIVQDPFVNEFIERPHLHIHIDQAPLTINKHLKINIKC